MPDVTLFLFPDSTLRLSPQGTTIGQKPHFTEDAAGNPVITGLEFFVDVDALARSLGLDDPQQIGTDEHTLNLPASLQGFFEPEAVHIVAVPEFRGEFSSPLLDNADHGAAVAFDGGHGSSPCGGLSNPTIERLGGPVSAAMSPSANGPEG
jgi:hypothetical protein